MSSGFKKKVQINFVPAKSQLSRQTFSLKIGENNIFTNRWKWCIITHKEIHRGINLMIRHRVLLHNAGVAELADAPDLGSGGSPCRFKSCRPHQKRMLVARRSSIFFLFGAGSMTLMFAPQTKSCFAFGECCAPPKSDACRTAIKHLFPFGGGFHDIDVCSANQVLFRRWRMLRPTTNGCLSHSNQVSFILFINLRSLFFVESVKNEAQNR